MAIVENNTAGVHEPEEANRTREAGNRDEVEGAVANTLKVFRNGASLPPKVFGVGFIDWLDELTFIASFAPAHKIYGNIW